MAFDVHRDRPLNTIVKQETERYNILWKTIIDTINSILLAQKGEATLSDDLAAAMDQMQRGMVPQVWKAVSYPTLKPLAEYVKNLSLRLQTFHQWVNKGATQAPQLFWISGFFSTQSFLTAVLQQFARKNKVEIDLLSFEFKFLDGTEQQDNTDYENEIFREQIAKTRGLVIQRPEDGVLISGLYFESARWDYKRHCITEQKPK